MAFSINQLRQSKFIFLRNIVIFFQSSIKFIRHLYIYIWNIAILTWLCFYELIYFSYLNYPMLYFITLYGGKPSWIITKLKYVYIFVIWIYINYFNFFKREKFLMQFVATLTFYGHKTCCYVPSYFRDKRYQLVTFSIRSFPFIFFRRHF